MKIFVAKLNKEKLSSASSAAERSFFLVMAHLVNEINALNKLILWSHEYPTQNTAEENGKMSLTFLLLRLLAGKLSEGNELLHKKFYGSKISKNYEPALSAKGREALSQIKQYFRGTNNVAAIRNNYAFHYSPEELDSVLPTISEELELYVSDGGGANTLYYFAEVLAIRAILNSIDDKDGYSAYKKLTEELPMIAGWFIDFAEALLVEFLSKQEENLWDGFAEEVKFDKLPSISEIKIPWFTDTTELSTWRT
jgi:hypothetical protein